MKMFSSLLITTLITAVTGDFFRNSPICQDFLCWNSNINQETFRLCQQIGCYDDHTKPDPPPIPTLYTDNTIPPYYDPGPYSPPMTYPPVPSLPTPAPYQSDSILPYYDPGPYSPPMTYPPVPSLPTHAPYQNNYIKPYYNPATYYPPHSRFHPVPFVPKVKIPAPITVNESNIEIGKNDSQWLLKSFEWQGIDVLVPDLRWNLTEMAKEFKVIVDNSGEDWEQNVTNNVMADSSKRDILRNLSSALILCNCSDAMEKWYEVIQLNPKFEKYFVKWLGTIDTGNTDKDLGNIWSGNKHPPKHTNDHPYHPDPYYPYFPMDAPVYNPFMSTTNNQYMDWLASTMYPSMFYEPYASYYPNMFPYSNQPYFQQQWHASDSYYPNEHLPYYAATGPQYINRPSDLTHPSNMTETNSPNVTVTFNLQTYNVSKCKITVTLPQSATLEQLLTKAAQLTSCFNYEIVIYNNNSLRNGKYVETIYNITANNSNIWMITKNNGHTDLNLDHQPQNGDTININNVNV